MTDIYISDKVSAAAMRAYLTLADTDRNAQFADCMIAALRAGLMAWPGMYKYPGTKICLPLQEKSDAGKIAWEQASAELAEIEAIAEENATIAALRAKNERLLAALVEIGDFNIHGWTMQTERARAALEDRT